MADAFECGSDPSGSIKAGSLLTNWGPVNFSEKTLLNGETDRQAYRQTEITNKAVRSIYHKQDLNRVRLPKITQRSVYIHSNADLHTYVCVCVCV